MNKNRYENFKVLWKSYHEKIKMRNYYLRNTGKTRSPLGRVFDFVFLRIAIFIASYIWFIQRTKSLKLSLQLAILFTLFASLALHLWVRKQVEKKGAKMRKEVARNFLMDEIMQLDKKEFQDQLVKLLKKIDRFTEVKSREKLIETHYDNNLPIAIGFNHIPHTEDTSPQEIKDFIHRIETAGFSYGWFITPGSFKESSIEMIQKYSKVKIEAIDGQQLLNMMEEAGMIPDEKTIDEIIIKKIEGNKRQWDKIKKEIITPKKVKSCLIYSLIFFIISQLLVSSSLYYLVLSVLFVFLALITYMLRPKEEDKISSAAPPIPENRNDGTA